VGTALGSGSALDAARAWLRAQGGDERVVEAPWEVMEAAPVRRDVPAGGSGVVARADALAIGLAAVQLGAGRARKTDPVDHAVGIVLHRKPGEEVAAGEALATVHARHEDSAAAAAAALAAAFAVVDGPVEPPPLVLETVR
jgi:thymidine phosphorylase